MLARDLPPAVEGMTFPKSMRWGEGRMRWVRPVHWLVALHGKDVLEVELLGVVASRESMGHRFLSKGPVRIPHPDRYEDSLAKARVVVDPQQRREQLRGKLAAAAHEAGGRLVPDPALLAEAADLVEWPNVVVGRFDERYLELPREILVTTLRYHQKCFSVQGEGGGLLPAFLALANTDRDPSGHVRRGNEWVVVGRLEDARFFWNEDRKAPLASHSEALNGVSFHARLGSYAEKASRMKALAGTIAERLSLTKAQADHCRQAAGLAKNDLVTGTVGEFPELQGRAGGLLLRAEGEPEPVARAVYSHYQPTGPDDEIPPTPEGCVVSIADKLNSLSQLIRVGKRPTGSRDPFGLRRAANGIFRILLERGWALSLQDLFDLAGSDKETLGFTLEWLQNFLRERGFTLNEIYAVFHPNVSGAEAFDWFLHDIVARLEAIRTVRDRSDFAHLVDLTKRVDNILLKGKEIIDSAAERVGDAADFEESKEAALRLRELIGRYGGEIAERARSREYPEVIDILARFVEPVDQFFVDVLVLDPENPKATLSRRELLGQLRGVLTRCFDIRELAGQADRRS